MKSYQTILQIYEGYARRYLDLHLLSQNSFDNQDPIQNYQVTTSINIQLHLNFHSQTCGHP